VVQRDPNDIEKLTPPPAVVATLPVIVLWLIVTGPP
jgi:hypothetical protein